MSVEATRYTVELLAAPSSVSLTCGDRTILLLLAGCANARSGHVAWPSIAWLAARAGMHRRSVERCLRRLVDHGAIAATERRGKSTEYRFPIGTKLSTGTAEGPRVETDALAPLGANPPPYGAQPTAVQRYEGQEGEEEEVPAAHFGRYHDRITKNMEKARKATA